ncbi:hypothetical protein BJ508DRAFT_113457 [Ascobolus immersus RN42]|uniref:Uncharacterized protein n=1 Tax=Ascobolus immersus RN42 TaxID=1160509 RepID=A0A3N4I9I2_ASCIM|nr:hypothetical protein BJ508DRAFT_113457 [Ascobolus immersus RN42]
MPSQSLGPVPECFRKRVTSIVVLISTTAFMFSCLRRAIERGDYDGFTFGDYWHSYAIGVYRACLNERQSFVTEVTNTAFLSPPWKMFENRREAGLVRQVQIDLINLALSAYAGNFIGSVLKDLVIFEKDPSCYVKVDSFYGYSYEAEDRRVYEKLHADLRILISIFRGLLDLRSESIEARIWRYLQE